MTVSKMRVHRGQFTTIPNRTIKDERLSLDTLGLLVSLLSRPGDWHFHKTELQAALKIGEQKLDRMFSELIEAGYVTRVDLRENGRFQTDWHVSPYPTKPGTVEPGTVEPVPVESGTTKKDKTKKDRTKTDNTNSAALFELAWERYPRKLNRKGAFEKFTARLREGVPFEELMKAVENYAETCIGKETSFIMHAATFFGPTRRWEDYRDGSTEPSRKRIFDEWIEEVSGGNHND